MEALILFVKTFGIQVSIGLFAGCLLVILIIYIISAITGRNFGFELGPVKINTKKNGNGESKIDKIKTLLKFENNKDNENSLLDTMVSAIKSRTREKDIIEFQQTVINQMRCAEDFNIQIKSLMTGSYANLLKAKDSTIDVRQHRDYKFYQVLVSSILDELKRNTLKESIKSIDIIALSPQEFEQFAEQKINVMITLMIEYLDLMYQNTSLVSRDEVHKENENLSTKIKELYRTMYHNIRSIIADDNKYMIDIDNKMNTDVTNIKNQLSKGCVVDKINSLLEEKPEEKKG
jgi:hypothetical protein